MSENLISTASYACAIASMGLLAGLVYFRALRTSVDLLAGGRGWFGAVALTVARITGALVALTLSARLGPMVLLAAFGGLLLARAIAVRSAGRIG